MTVWSKKLVEGEAKFDPEKVKKPQKIITFNVVPDQYLNIPFKRAKSLDKRSFCMYNNLANLRQRAMKGF